MWKLRQCCARPKFRNSEHGPGGLIQGWKAGRRLAGAGRCGGQKKSDDSR